MFRIAVIWSAARHVSFFPVVQSRALSFGATTGVVQACELFTMPSTRPSRWSQAFSTALEMSCRSELVNVLFAYGTPNPEIRSRERASAASCCPAYAAHTPTLVMRKAGSPETEPSKYDGSRCVTIIASRPPIEQPSKYEYCGASP